MHTTRYLRDSPQQEVGFVVFIAHVVCAMWEKSLAHHKLYFVYLSYPGN